jgi:iron(III) transport system permease protein
MARWRRAALVFLLATIGIPLAMPFLELLGTSPSRLTTHPERLLLLTGNTLLLVAGTLLVALPVGIAAAVLFYRTDLPGRGIMRFFTVLTLFVPLPVLTTAWQGGLGEVGLWTVAGRPWAEGFGPAIWIHAQAALPWVILIVGQGLCWVEPELEEDALLATGPWRVLVSVTLPRSKGAIAAAAGWVALQVSSEIAVADLMLVDTCAREVYNEFSLGGSDALARALAMSLPFIALGSAAVYWILIWLEWVLPPLAARLTEPRSLPLGRGRWPWFMVVLACLGLVAGFPLASLIWKTGLVGYPPQWSWTALRAHVGSSMHAELNLVWKSVLTMSLSAAIIASVALVLCWLALDAPSFRRLLFMLLAVAWVVPGPIVGLGLKETIGTLVVWVPYAPLSTALYDGPSPLPVLWAQLLHFLPSAVVGFWPVVRLLPRELRDSLQLDGASPWQELRHLVWPFLRRTWLAVVVVIAALALGEIGAVAMRVETPDWIMFAHELFNRMHYGQTPDVTALCLVLLLVVAGTGIIVAVGLAVLTGRKSRA